VGAVQLIWQFAVRTELLGFGIVNVAVQLDAAKKVVGLGVMTIDRLVGQGDPPPLLDWTL